MAYSLSLTVEKAYELLELTIRNDARPVIVIEDLGNSVKEYIVNLLFSDRNDTFIVDYNDFIMNQAFSIEKIGELSKYSYVIIENVRFLYGKSATAKILADFAKSMNENNTGVLFIGKRTLKDMAEFIELAGDNVQYVIEVDDEKGDSNE